jgi:hypothetical protein
LPVVVVLATHLGIRSNTLLPRLSAHDGSAHGARNQATERDEDGSGKDDVRAPGHVGHKEQDIDEEAQEADEEIDDAHDEDHQQVPRRVGWAVEVSNHGEDKHDESEEGGNWMNNEKC